MKPLLCDADDCGETAVTLVQDLTDGSSVALCPEHRVWYYVAAVEEATSGNAGPGKEVMPDEEMATTDHSRGQVTGASVSVPKSAGTEAPETGQEQDSPAPPPPREQRGNDSLDGRPENKRKPALASDAGDTQPRSDNRASHR